MQWKQLKVLGRSPTQAWAAKPHSSHDIRVKALGFSHPFVLCKVEKPKNGE